MKTANGSLPRLNVAEAIKAYHTIPELSTDDIQRIFGGGLGSTRMRRLKNEARAVIVQKGVPVFSAYNVNTRCAFEAWGLNIDQLEKGYSKLQKLGLAEKEGSA